MNIFMSFLGFFNGNEKFDDIAKNFEYKETKESLKLLEYVYHSTVYACLIQIDFTYINKKFDYQFGDSVKAMLKMLIASNNSIIYTSETSGKVFLFLDNPMTSDFKKALNDVVSNLLLKENKQLNESKKLIYIVDSDNSNVKFKIGPFAHLNLTKLFSRVLNTEIMLSEKRNSIQKYLKDLEIKNISSRAISDIDTIEQDYINNRSSIDNYNQVYELTDKKKISQIREKYEEYILNSGYLKNVFDLIEKGYANNDISYYSDIIIQNLLKYLIWEQMQTLQLISFKIEKIYQYFNRLDTETDIIRINNSYNDLRGWYDSTIGVLQDLYFNDSEKEIAYRILQIILNSKNSELDKKSMKELRNLVDELFDNLNIKGVFSIPFEKIRPSETAIEFMKKLFFYRYYMGNKYSNGLNYKDMFSSWLSNDFLKAGFYLIIDKPKYIFDANLYFNREFLFDDMKQKIYRHLIFMEIDGFNAFNTTYFPNDSDDLFYKKIIDGIFEISLKYLEKSQAYDHLSKEISDYDFFKSIMISILGDEIYFNFISKDSLNHKQKSFINDYVKDIKNFIIKITEEIVSLVTEKIEVMTSSGSAVFRRIIKENSGLFVKNETLTIGRLDVTAVISFNKLYESNPKDFELAVKEIDSYMSDYAKLKQNKGKIHIM